MRTKIKFFISILYIAITNKFKLNKGRLFIVPFIFKLFIMKIAFYILLKINYCKNYIKYK